MEDSDRRISTLVGGLHKSITGFQYLKLLLFFLEFFLDSRLAVPYFNEKNKYPKRTHFRIIKEVDLAVQTSRTTLSLLPQSQTFLALITILVITLKYKDCFLLVEMSIPFFNSDF